MRFVPGQRIKKVRGRVCLGLEATFLAYKPIEEDRYDMDVVVASDFLCPSEFEWLGVRIPGPDVPIPAGSRTGAISSQWEPAIPPDMESIEEATELLQTDEVTA